MTGLQRRVVTAGGLVALFSLILSLPLFIPALKILPPLIAMLLSLAGLAECRKLNKSYQVLPEIRNLSYLSHIFPIVGVFLFATYYSYYSSWAGLFSLTALLSIIAATLLLCTYFLHSSLEPKSLVSLLSLHIITLYTVGFGGASLVALCIGPESARYIAFFICVIAVNDSAAYFIGRFFGKTQLSPLISPKKTTLGAYAGLIGGGCAAIVASGLLPVSELDFSLIFLLGVLLSLAGQIGDLAISFLKRVCDTKDTGDLLPGHGGILDRFDAIFFTAPLYLALLAYIEQSLVGVS